MTQGSLPMSFTGPMADDGNDDNMGDNMEVADGVCVHVRAHVCVWCVCVHVCHTLVH